MSHCIIIANKKYSHHTKAIFKEFSICASALSYRFSQSQIFSTTYPLLSLTLWLLYFNLIKNFTMIMNAVGLAPERIKSLECHSLTSLGHGTYIHLNKLILPSSISPLRPCHHICCTSYSFLLLIVDSLVPPVSLSILTYMNNPSFISLLLSSSSDIFLLNLFSLFLPFFSLSFFSPARSLNSLLISFAVWFGLSAVHSLPRFAEVCLPHLLKMAAAQAKPTQALASSHEHYRGAPLAARREADPRQHLPMSLRVASQQP